MLNKIAITKFWLDVFGEIVGLGGGLVALQLLSTLIKGNCPFGIPIESFSKFMWQFLWYDVLWSTNPPPLLSATKMIINNTLWPRRSLVGHHYCAAYDVRIIFCILLSFSLYLGYLAPTLLRSPQDFDKISSLHAAFFSKIISPLRMNISFVINWRNEPIILV